MSPLDPHLDHARRRWLLTMSALGAVGAVTSRPIQAQESPASGWATEKLAGPMPELGARLKVPPADLLGGGRFDPQKAEGQTLLVYWWSSTCPFCAVQSPEMEKFWRAHQKSRLQFLGLSIDKKPQDALSYLQKKAYTFPSAWVNAEIHRALPKPKGLPITLIRGRDGRLLAAEKGQMFPEDVEALKQFV